MHGICPNHLGGLTLNHPAGDRLKKPDAKQQDIDEKLEDLNFLCVENDISIQYNTVCHLYTCISGYSMKNYPMESQIRVMFH